MNAAQIKARLDNQSGVARKVFECVPVGSRWSTNLIANEYERLHGTRPNSHALIACLHRLHESKLIVGGPDTWQRDTHATRERLDDALGAPAPETPAELKPGPVSIAPPPPPNPLSAIGELTARIRRMCDEIDERALELEEMRKKAGDGSEQLEQLRTLLRGVLPS